MLDGGMAVIKMKGRRFGDAMRAARLAKGVTQDELAHRLGVTRQAVQQLENGKDVLLGTVTRVAEALGTDVRELVG